MGCVQSKSAVEAPPAAAAGGGGGGAAAAAAPKQQQQATAATSKPTASQPSPQADQYTCSLKTATYEAVGDLRQPAAAADAAPNGAPQQQQQQQYNPAEGGGQAGCPLLVLYKDVGANSMDVPVPPDEQDRFDQLCSYNMLDTEPEEAYDRITALCKTLFNVPIAMVTFVDRDRVWLKSVQGLHGLTQVERRQSICAWTLLSRYPEALVVEDLTQDVRFASFPVVTGWPHVRCYAACPLVNHERVRLGTLCILDTKPRQFSADDATLLTQLANMVMREVERKRAMNDALCSAALRHKSGNSVTHDSTAIMLCNMGAPKWSIHLVNDAWQRVTGISQELAVGSHFWDLFEPPPPPQVQAYRLAIEQQRNFELRVPTNINSGGGFDRAHPVSATPTGSVAGSTAGDSLASLPGAGSASKQQGHAMPSVRGWGSADAGGGGAAQGAAAGSPGGSGAPPLAPPGGAGSAGAVDPARRRSLGSAPAAGGGMRYIRFQFRSVSSVASHMAPAVSVPPSLLTHSDGACYYWATVDAPAGGRGGGAGGAAAGNGDVNMFDGGYALSQAVLMEHGRMDASAGSACPSSGAYTLPSSDSSVASGPLRTIFSLLPEDNPFQEITLGSLLGWGSYGRVHRGYWNGSLVAVKVLESVAGDFNPRSTLEPLLHHRLSHPNVVAMFDVCTQELDVCDDGRSLQEVWMVLEFCNRGTLSDAIQRGWLLSVQDGAPQPGHVNLRKALATAREVAAAMDYLHSQHVLHGDLNGNNILLAGAAATGGAGTAAAAGAPGAASGAAAAAVDARGFTAKVADFGLSRILPAENEKIITRTHGTITHMAPEVITEATHSKAADVYSFGVVLYELLSGAKAYAGMHYAQVVSSITEGRLLQQLAGVADAMPAGLLDLLAGCLATKPGDRPSFAEVHRRLEEIEASVLASAPPAASLAAAAASAAAAADAAAAARKQQAPAAGSGAGSGAAPIAAVAAAAAAAASPDSSLGRQSLADVLAAAQQQQPPLALGSK